MPSLSSRPPGGRLYHSRSIWISSHRLTTFNPTHFLLSLTSILNTTLSSTLVANLSTLSSRTNSRRACHPFHFDILCVPLLARLAPFLQPTETDRTTNGPRGDLAPAHRSTYPAFCPLFQINKERGRTAGELGSIVHSVSPTPRPPDLRQDPTLVSVNVARKRAPTQPFSFVNVFDLRSTRVTHERSDSARSVIVNQKRVDMSPSPAPCPVLPIVGLGRFDSFESNL